MPFEIERKFLVDHSKWNNVPKHKKSLIRQGYILSEPSRTIRVRVTDNKGFMTLKGKTRGATRPEFEYEIPVNEAQEILRLFCNSVIEKTRYYIHFNGKTWEIDVFEGDNEGLIIAEIELDSENEQFELPEWIEKEVTQEEKYYNSLLSERPYKSWTE